MSRNFRQLSCWMAPETLFKQVVVTGIKRRTASVDPKVVAQLLAMGRGELPEVLPEQWARAFIAEYGEGLLDAVRDQNPPVFTGKELLGRVNVMAGLARTPFPAQRDVVHAVATLLIDRNQPASIINAEMGTGKTMMAIALAAVCHAEGIRRSLVICPPHLVYKWRREIKETVPNARVWILNGPDTLTKLLQISYHRAISVPPAY